MKKWRLTTRQQIGLNLLVIFTLGASLGLYNWITTHPYIPTCFPDSPDLRPSLSDLQEKSERDFLKSLPISTANVQDLSEFYSFETPDNVSPGSEVSSNNAISALEISPNNAFVVASYVNGYHSPRIFDLESGEITLIPEIKSVNSIAISPDNKIIAFYNFQGNIFLWDMVSKTQIASWDVGNASNTNTLLFKSNRDLIYLSGSSVYLCDLSSKKNQKLFDKFGSGRLADIMLDNSEVKIIYSTTGDGDSSGTPAAGIWDFNVPDSLQTFNSHDTRIMDISVSSDGQRMASISYGGHIDLVDVPSAQMLSPLNVNNSASNYNIALNLDGTLLIIANKPGNDNRTRGEKGYLDFWDVDKGTLITTLEAHTQELTSLIFNAAGNLLVSGSVDGTAKVWGIPPQ